MVMMKGMRTMSYLKIMNGHVKYNVERTIISWIKLFSLLLHLALFTLHNLEIKGSVHPFKIHMILIFWILESQPRLARYSIKP